MNTELAVSTIMGLQRLLWREASSETNRAEILPNATGDPMEMAALLRHECPMVPAKDCNAIVERWFALRHEIPQSAPPSFPRLCELLLPPYIYAEDARYFAMRSIRRTYGVLLSSNTASAAHHFARIVSAILMELSGDWISYDALRSSLIAQLETGRYEHDAQRIFSTFIDVCLVLELLTLKPDRTVSLARECTDTEYLMNHLFGVPTRIPGFDALFGGGGLMFCDSMQSEAADSLEKPAQVQTIGSRSVLCIGPVGSGKTLLSLQIAVEVARKGGVAWIIALEQTEEECLYSLEAIGVNTNHPAFKVVRGGLTDSFLALSDPSPAQGALVFLRPGELAPDEEPPDYSKFVADTKERLTWMSRYPLRLLVVDPVNAITQRPEKDEALRFKTQKLFEAAKRANVNIWFTSERLVDAWESNRFEENIADTVIHLGSGFELGQPRRYIEVTKSRFRTSLPGAMDL